MWELEEFKEFEVFKAFRGRVEVEVLISFLITRGQSAEKESCMEGPTYIHHRLHELLSSRILNDAI